MIVVELDTADKVVVVVVGDMEMKRSSQTTKSLFKVSPPTLQKKILLSSLDQLVSLRMTRRQENRESLFTKIETLVCQRVRLLLHMMILMLLSLPFNGSMAKISMVNQSKSVWQ